MLGLAATVLQPNGIASPTAKPASNVSVSECPRQANHSTLTTTEAMRTLWPKLRGVQSTASSNAKTTRTSAQPDRFVTETETVLVAVS